MRTINRELCVEIKEISALNPYSNNPRTHSKKQIKQIAESMRVFGWTNPILIDREGGIIAGHGRLEAANRLGLDRVPTICLEDMTDEQKRAYVLADNKLAENAGWDKGLLAIELQGLSEINLDFDITVTGFEMGEIDIILGELDETDSGEAETVPEIDPTLPTISQSGDLWVLGRHRLYCGDATDAESYARLMDGEGAQMVFMDPPYNVPIDGHVCGLGNVKHDEFAMAVGEMSEAEFTDFLKSVLCHLSDNSVDGSIHYICMDWRHVFELLSAGRDAYTELKNICVWNKANGGMGSLYRSKHEFVCAFKNGTAPHINNVQLGKYGRYRTNVWDYAGVNGFGADREDLALHPTVKPVALVEDAIKDCSNRGDIILDVFSGSGSTIIAAEKSGRRGFGMELDPKYVDVTLRRFRDLTGVEPIEERSGLPFNVLE